MTQRSITAFFTRPPVSRELETPSDPDPLGDEFSIKDKFGDSPVRSYPGKRKRPQKILSDSEDEDQSKSSKVNKTEKITLSEDASDNKSYTKDASRVETRLNGSNELKKAKSTSPDSTDSKTSKRTNKKYSSPQKNKMKHKDSEDSSTKTDKKNLIETTNKISKKLAAFKKSDNKAKHSDEENSKPVVEEKSGQIEDGKSELSKEETLECKDEEKCDVQDDDGDTLKDNIINEEKTPAKQKATMSSFFGLAKSEKGSDDNAAEKAYNPSKAHYHPIEDACWAYGAVVPYFALSRTLEKIEETAARLKMVEILSNYFRSVIVLSPDDLLPSVYLCLNSIAPAFEALELGIAETYLMKAIAHSTGRTLAQIKAHASSLGDLGLVAEHCKCSQRMMFTPPPLTVRSVFNKLKEIAQMTGNASQSKKIDKIQTMFVACKGPEARYLIRSLAGKLRIGLAEQSVLQALAQACLMTPPGQEYPPEIINATKNLSTEKFKAKLDEHSLVLKTTYCECPNYNLIMPVILKEGLFALPEHCKLTPGVPLKPMLAHPTKGVQEVLKRFEDLKFTCEWKYDGERAQIHLAEDGTISIYSRNQENNTSKYPDIVSRLKTTLKDTVKSCILDTEAVAWDLETQKIRPFQILTTRKRKDANESEIKVQVCVFMFDLLYLNGEPLVKEPLIRRRKLLQEHFQAVDGQWAFATSMDTSTMEEVQEFLEESVKGNCEGLMVKTLEEDATYEIAKRSRNWLKLKKDYVDGVGDSIDVVVLGGYLGRGKRTGHYGGFLLGCYDPENEEYQSLCKIGTGFSDDDLQKHSEFFKEHIIESAKSYYRCDSTLEPDHWFNAVQVWEIKCADLSLSPVHRAAIGIVDPEKGISLRFPRFLRIRDDKTVEDATSAQQIAYMYRNQDIIKNQQKDNQKIGEEDFY